jgi:hypothetical protein
MALRWSRDLACLWLVLSAALPVRSDEASSRTARDGLPMAQAAADAWADDARLVWIENDAELDSEGRAAAWGYLYFSPEKRALRSYSVRAGKLTVAQDHVVSTEAPGVDLGWKDSAEAAHAAWKHGGRDFASGNGTLESLLLVRGVFAQESAWVAIFSAERQPRLYLVLDALKGDVLKRWRG